ncbi:MAG TPA: formimidoylglutamase [Gemmatimonadales bacterium]|nr:formimidoylglutamase [Gemmatimonadales bacterium]
MTRILPAVKTFVPDTAPDDPRIGRLLGTRLGKDETPRAVLLGFPSDEGVRRNGGRVGAASGPRAIRTALYRLTPDPKFEAFEDLLGRTRDLGDLEVSRNLELDQKHLGEALAPHLEAGTFVIVLGGGHETSYGHFQGYVLARRGVEILNWDAHADVRELKQEQAHSGSPFRQAIEDPSGTCRRYSVAGLQPHSVARTHLEFVQHHGRAVWRNEVTRESIEELYRSVRAPALVSFDLDAVNEAEAPGVSAPAAGGLSSELWLTAAYAAGHSSAVASADVVELNPAVDRDGQTARLAALTVWWILRGYTERA